MFDDPTEAITDFVVWMARVALAALAALGVWYMIWTYDNKIYPRSQFINQCIIDHKELPQPDLYCEAIWRQGGGR